jgi:ABC-type Zn uptake system ZnuABC Zn-binding protein ZnuA
MRSLLPSLAGACALAWGVALVVGAFADGPRSHGRVVVATTTQAADLARQVAGDRVRVVGLLAPNADPHEHEVRPGDVAAVRAARVLVRSGGEVDAWIEDVADAAGGDAREVDLLAAVGGTRDDPHWWQDPRNAARAVEAIRAALTAADPGGAAIYARNARAYERRLRAADRAVARCWSGVPAAQRQLVTTHDSYGYYARRYGLTVRGSVLDSLSSRGQPSASALADLIDDLRARHVRAIFTERALNASVEEAVAREAGTRVATLQGDALGRGQTYMESLAADTRALTLGLTGRACEVSP